jgi:MoaA/NifB/PqqE/SkfB family radical SAM enzyme
MTIRKKLLTTKIQKVQIDPFGYCNAKCWFCPVRYKPQPEIGLNPMPVALLENILQQIDSHKKDPNGIIDSSLDLILTAHYNEVLLYKHIEEFFKLMRKYKLKTFVLSNGISLSREKTDLIKDYLDVVAQVGLNIPAFERELWANRSGFSPDLFDRLIGNLQYAESQFAPINYNIVIHVNGLNPVEFENKWISPGPGFKDLNLNLNKYNNEHEAQFQLARKLFPKLNVAKAGLFDRAASIDIISNQQFIKKMNQGKKVVGCKSWGDRAVEWLHVNSAGQTFLCCNDYNFDYVFGDLSKQSLSEIWASERHVEVLNKAFNEICTKCLYAVFE